MTDFESELAAAQKEILRLRKVIEGARCSDDCNSRTPFCSICRVSVDKHPSFFVEVNGVMVLKKDQCPKFTWVHPACNCWKAKVLKHA